MGTKKKKNEKSDPNYKAQRAFVFISFIFVFISGIGALGAGYWIIARISGISIEFDFTVAGLLIILFIGYLVGLYGILKPKPPLHQVGTYTSVLNFIISLIITISGNRQGVLLGAISFIHAYLGIRFPLELEDTSDRSLK